MEKYIAVSRTSAQSLPYTSLTSSRTPQKTSWILSSEEKKEAEERAKKEAEEERKREEARKKAEEEAKKKAAAAAKAKAAAEAKAKKPP